MKQVSEKDYNSIRVECDLILFEKPSDKFRQGNNLLHVIREHPIFLSQYHPVIDNNFFKFHFLLLSRLTLNILKIPLNFFQSILQSFHGNEEYNIKKNISSIFFSHLLNNSFIKHQKDFYFSSLPEKFVSPNNDYMIFYLNYTNSSSRKINSYFKKNKKNKIALPKTLSLREEFKISFGLLKDGFYLWSKSYDYSGIKMKLRKLAAVEAISSSSHFSIRMASFTEKLVFNYNPDYIFTTYEGHAWERLVYFSAKKKNKNIKNIGYQHAVIFENQHAIKRKLHKNFNPDFIITSGENGRSILEKSKIIPKSKIIIFGSPRTKFKKANFIPFNDTKRGILFLPEGDYKECRLMLELAFEVSKLLRNFSIIIRFHPLISVDRLSKQYKLMLTKNKNLEFSNLALEKDLERANYAIYRGTSAIIKALEHGLYPCYYSIINEIPINPLHSIQDKIDFISNSNDLSRIILMNEVKKKRKLKSIQNHINKYFSQIDYKSILKIKEFK